jgi:hypothetical protein
MKSVDPLDVLNEALRDAEDAIAERNLGVMACVPIGPEEDHHHLWYMRLEGTWCIVYEDSARVKTPLLKSSKERRINAAEALCHLYAELLKNKDQERAATLDAIAVIKSFTETVRADLKNGARR